MFYSKVNLATKEGGIMKTILIAFVIVALALEAFGQQAVKGTKEYYLEKSKKQRQTGTVLLVGGTAMAITGILIMGSGDSEGEVGMSQQDATGSFLFLGGLVADLISIPILISASHHKRIAADLTFDYQRINVPQQNGMTRAAQPGVTLRIRF